MEKLIVTIDGPAGSGKSTIAKLLAEKINAYFLDTGAMYRALTLAALNSNTDLVDEEALLDCLKNNSFTFEYRNGKTVVTVDNVDVTEQIRTPEVTASAKYIASAWRIRAELVEMQRQFAAENKLIVTEGRDQGTVVFPDADVKIFLTAEANERAKRRQLELQQKGSDIPIEIIKTAIENRDKTDEDRKVGPLKPADDAVKVDTTNLNIEQVVDTIYNIVKDKF